MNEKLRILCAGELLWDVFPTGRRPGGAPANVAYHATCLGEAGIVLSRIGEDSDGEALLAELRAHGTDVSFVQRDPAHPTGRVSVDLRRPADPRYTIHEGVAWDHLELDAASSRVAAGADAVVFGSLAQRCPRSRETIRACVERAPDALSFFDVNLRPPFVSEAVLRDSLALADIVKLNRDEVREVCGLLGLPDPGPEALARALFDEHGVREMFVTCGAKGCLALSPGESVSVPGRPVEVRDTVGAGDAFTAALAVARLRGGSAADAARAANELGAVVAARDGAMPPPDADYLAVARRIRETAPGSAS